MMNIGMNDLNPAAAPLWLNLTLFVLAATVVWFAGSRLTRYADAISNRTGLGTALVGALFLGGITSLPEFATTISASVIGNPSIAVNNLLGGVAMQVAILALADAFGRDAAISGQVRNPAVYMQGVSLVLLLLLAGAGILLGDLSILGVGMWSTAILLAALYAFVTINKRQEHNSTEEQGARKETKGSPDVQVEHLWFRTLVASGIILVAGFALARIGDVLAEQTGLGSTFVGAVLVAIATSLPEVSTTLSAVLLGQYTLAFANIFGTNILDISAIFLADLVYRGGPVLNQVPNSSIITAVLGMVVTVVYLTGLKRKSKPVVLGMGIDSVAVAILYLGGVAVLYLVR